GWTRSASAPARPRRVACAIALRVDSALTPAISGSRGGSRSRANSSSFSFSSRSRSAPSPVEPKSTIPSTGRASQPRRFSRKLIGAMSPVTGSNGLVTGIMVPRYHTFSGKGPDLELEVGRVRRRRARDLEFDHIRGDEFHQVLIEGLRAVRVPSLLDQFEDVARALRVEDPIPDRRRHHHDLTRDDAA